MKKLIALLCLFLIAGCASASVALRMDAGAVLLDANGAEILPPGSYADIVSLGNGLFAAAVGEKYALMDGSGAVLSGFDFDHIILKDGMILGGRDGKTCILNTDGSMRTEAVYGMIVPDGSGGAWAVRGENGDAVSDELLLIDSRGMEINTGMFVRSMDESAGNGLIAVLPADADSYVYCDAEGKQAFGGSYDTAGTFDHGLATVSAGGFFGVINARGEIILSAEYSFAAVSNGKILAAKEDGLTLFDAEGNVLLGFEGGNLSASFVGEYVQVFDGESLRVFTADGDLACEASGDASVYEGLDGRLILSRGAWGEKGVSLSGSENSFQNLYPLGYAAGEPVYAFMEARVAKYMNNLLGEVQFSTDMDTARYGIADQDGNMLVPAVYESIEYLQDNRFLVRNGNQWRMIDAKGRTFWRMNGEEISPG